MQRARSLFGEYTAHLRSVLAAAFDKPPVVPGRTEPVAVVHSWGPQFQRMTEALTQEFEEKGAATSMVLQFDGDTGCWTANAFDPFTDAFTESSDSPTPYEAARQVLSVRRAKA